MTNTSDQILLRRAAITLIAGCVIAALYFAREVFIPIILAIVLGFLLTPVVRWLERLHLGRILSVSLVVMASMSLAGGVGYLVFSQASELLVDLPKYRTSIIDKVRRARASMPGPLNSASKMAEEIREEILQPNGNGTEGVSDSTGELGQVESVPASTASTPVKVEVVGTQNPIDLIVRYASPVVYPLATIGVAIVCLLFFLIYREDLRDRLLRVCGPSNLQLTTEAIADSGVRVARYFLALFIANTAIGIVIGIGLYFIGVPKAPLWGLLAAVLRVIPYVGPFIAALFPAAIAAATSDSWMPPLMVIGWTVLADILSANLLEPWLFSAGVGASPTAIIVSFMFWAWLWGGIGLVLATPITVCLIVLGKHVPAFEVFYILLSNEPVLAPKLRLYQRLLSADRVESLKVIREFQEKESPLGTYDRLVVPALAQIQHDFNAGLLDEKRMSCARELVEELLAPPSKKMEETSEAAPAIIPPDLGSFVFIADRGAFDEFVPRLLANATESIFTSKVLPASVLASEVVEEVREQNDAACVVFTAVEPLGIDRILHVRHRLELAGVALPMHVCFLCTSDRGRMYRRRLRRSYGMSVSANLSELHTFLQGKSRPDNTESRQDVEKMLPSDSGQQPAMARVVPV